MQCLRILYFLIMFISSAKAFVSRQPIFARQWTRYMASETTIVDICREKIQKALDTDSVKVTGAYDDPNGSHISIEVISSKFEGKRPVQRQQLVYKAIWEELQGPVHAVDEMICKTPNE